MAAHAKRMPRAGLASLRGGCVPEPDGAHPVAAVSRPALTPPTVHRYRRNPPNFAALAQKYPGLNACVYVEKKPARRADHAHPATVPTVPGGLAQTPGDRACVPVSHRFSAWDSAS